jgi:hypothetical protein
MKIKILPSFILLSFFILLPVYIVTDYNKAYAKVKHDMVYGLTVSKSVEKNKELTLLNGLNIITVIPDNTQNTVSCSFKKNVDVLYENVNTNKCLFRYRAKEKIKMIVTITTDNDNDIGVELHHLVK